MNIVDQDHASESSNTKAYALGGFVLAFAALLPLTLIMAQTMGVPMGLGSALIFAGSGAGVFGVVAGTLGGVG